MMIEGIGAVIPERIEVRLSSRRIGELKELANRRERFRAYGSSTQTWKRGLTSSPTFRGLIGEEGCARWLSKALGLPITIDEEDRPSGDLCRDLVVFGRVIQIKCRARYYNAFLIRRQDDQGRIVPLAAVDYFVQVTWAYDGKSGRSSEVPVTIDGWLTRRDVADGRLAKARRGDHVNLEIPDSELRDPKDLADLLVGLKDVHGSDWKRG